MLVQQRSPVEIRCFRQTYAMSETLALRYRLDVLIPTYDFKHPRWNNRG